METLTILDRYFELSDLAGADPRAFEELISLFAEDATLHPNGSSSLQGKQEIADFFQRFFARNVLMHHVWSTRSVNETLQTAWAVAGKHQDGTVFALQGTDIAHVNTDGKIGSLSVLPTR